jgi:hypothetical protein
MVTRRKMMMMMTGSKWEKEVERAMKQKKLTFDDKTNGQI